MYIMKSKKQKRNKKCAIEDDIDKTILNDTNKAIYNDEEES